MEKKKLLIRVYIQRQKSLLALHRVCVWGLASALAMPTESSKGCGPARITKCFGKPANQQRRREAVPQQRAGMQAGILTKPIHIETRPCAEDVVTTVLVAVVLRWTEHRK